MDAHGKEHEKNVDGTQQIEDQINNQNYKYVSFSRRRAWRGTHSGSTESRSLKLTQGLTGSDRKEAMEAHDTAEKSQPNSRTQAEG